MMFSSAFLVLMQLFSLQLLVTSAPMSQLSGDLVEEAHVLLKNLSGDFPVRCRPYNQFLPNMSFDDPALCAVKANRHQCDPAMGLLKASLQGAANIFQDNDVPFGKGGVSWDQKKLEEFQSIQYQLLEWGSWPPVENVSGVLSSYFHNVTAVIGQQDSAPCGWMALRRDLLSTLKLILLRCRACFTWRRKY